MPIRFPNNVYTQAMPPTEWLGNLAKAAYMAAWHIGRGEEFDAASLSDEISPGAPLPELPNAAKLSDVATMACADLADLFLSIDSPLAIEESSFSAYDGSSIGAQPVTQMAGTMEVLQAISEHALPLVRVPLVPLIQSATNIVMQSSVDNRMLSDERMVSALSSYYASFDQRFQAIFYPSTRAKTELLSCAAYEDLSSALWLAATADGLPEVQDIDWCWGAMAFAPSSTVVRDAYDMLDAHAQSVLESGGIVPADGIISRGARIRPMVGTQAIAISAGGGDMVLEAPVDEEEPVPIDEAPAPDADAGDAPAGSVGEEGLAMAREALPSVDMALATAAAEDYTANEEVCPYPELPLPVALDPAIDTQLMVIEAMGKSYSHPVTTVGAADEILSYARATTGSQALSQAIDDLRRGIADAHKSTLMAGTDLPHGVVFRRDYFLQLVLINLLGDPAAGRSMSLPLSLRQLEALIRVYKRKQLMPALRADFGMEDDIDEADMVDRIASLLTEADFAREVVTYGMLRYDPIRCTVSALSAVMSPSTRSKAKVTKLDAPDLLSMLLEAPSAFNEAYGRIKKKRALALLSHDGAQQLPHPMWSGMRFSGFPVGAKTRTVGSDKSGSDDLRDRLRDALGGAALSQRLAEFGSYDGAMPPAMAPVMRSILALDGREAGDDVTFGDYVDALCSILPGEASGVFAVRTTGYDISPLVFRIADTLYHSGVWRPLRKAGMPLDDAMARSLGAVSLAYALGLAIIACKSRLPGVRGGEGPAYSQSPGKGNLVENAAYPQFWYAASLLLPSGGRAGQGDGAQGGQQSRAGRFHRGGATPNLNSFGEDMTAAAASESRVVVERDEELQQLVSVLLRREKANVMILGEAGVGKSALVELLASQIAKGRVPQKLLGKRLFRIDVMTLASGGEVLIQHVFEEAKATGAILFIDEIHSLPQAATNALKPYLARGEVSLIGATTNAEYQATILKDKALARRFSTIRLRELTQEQAVICLKARVSEYEQWHGVAYDTKVPYAAAIAAATYMTNRHTPDRELDVLDTAGSIAAMDGRQVVVEDDAYAAVRQLSGNRSVISMSEVVRSLGSDDGELERRRDETFGDMVGQAEAKNKVTERLALGQMGLRAGDSPRNVLMFVGPSGVGKTMMAERIPKFLGVGADAALLVNMNEFARGHEYSRLVGSPAGYIGYEQGGILTNFAMAHPDGVVIFDEIEKAATKVRQILFNLFDRGYIDAASGEHVDCRSMTFVCTSNIGFESGLSHPVGFVHEEDGRSYQQRVDTCREALVRALGAPLVGRLDEIVVFDELTSDDLREAVRIEYHKMAESYMGNAGIDITEFYPESSLDELLDGISDKEISEIGARSVARRVENEIKRRFAGTGGR